MLFLAVLLVIEVWGYSPLGGAVIVSALPAATLAVRPLSRRLTRDGGDLRRLALLALGLVALALLPSSTVAYIVLALVFCGAGLGLAVPLLSADALDLSAGATRSGTLTVGIRHLGLVLALAVIAPLLAHNLPSAGHRATLQATAVLLDAPVPITKKIPIAVGVARELDRRGPVRCPISRGPFDENGAGSDAELRQTRDRLVGAVEETITRAFRPAFLFSAALAAAALLLAALVRRRVHDVRLNAATSVLAVLLAGALLLIGFEAVRGRSTHPVRIANPCLPRTLPAASGLDGTVQEVVLAGLDRAACNLGASREAVVLSIAGSSAGGGPHWTQAKRHRGRASGAARIAGGGGSAAGTFRRSRRRSWRS